MRVLYCSKAKPVMRVEAPKAQVDLHSRNYPFCNNVILAKAICILPLLQYQIVIQIKVKNAEY